MSHCNYKASLKGNLKGHIQAMHEGKSYISHSKYSIVLCYGSSSPLRVIEEHKKSGQNRVKIECHPNLGVRNIWTMSVGGVNCFLSWKLCVSTETDTQMILAGRFSKTLTATMPSVCYRWFLFQNIRTMQNSRITPLMFQTNVSFYELNPALRG